MKSASNRAVWFDVGMLPIQFGVALSERAFLAEAKRLKVVGWTEFVISGARATTHICNSEAGRCVVLVCVDLIKLPKISRAQVASVVAHEAVHVWQTAKRKMNEDAPGDEIEAYAVQRFTQDMLNVIWGYS